MDENLRRKLLAEYKDITNIFTENQDNCDILMGRLTDVLPLDEGKFKVESLVGNKETFKAVIMTQLASEADIEGFVQNWALRNHETLRKKTPRKTKTYETVRYYRCQHKTYHQKSMNPGEKIKEKSSKRHKNTDCPFTIVFKLKEVGQASCIIDLEYNHNHSTEAAQVYSYEDIPTDLKERIFTLFSINYTPGSAYKEIYKSVKNGCKSDQEFHEKMSHRSIMPRRSDFNQLYTLHKIKNYGSKDLRSMFDLLHLKAKKLKEDNCDYSICIQEHDDEDDSPFILALITPLMKRVHRMVSSALFLMFGCCFRSLMYSIRCPPTPPILTHIPSPEPKPRFSIVKSTYLYLYPTKMDSWTRKINFFL